ncbi:AC160405.1 [Phodopus roborovskii]|uniref:AC160405.1 protein n=1 Tax=Phodopus roborovskii TaxID=109678 RepID=A0AAU9ZB24_PHORO|nr:AC160405.1 [Phodopus roborovskii]
MLTSSSTCLFSGVCVALLAVALAYYFYCWVGPCPTLAGTSWFFFCMTSDLSTLDMCCS